MAEGELGEGVLLFLFQSITEHHNEIREKSLHVSKSKRETR